MGGYPGKTIVKVDNHIGYVIYNPNAMDGEAYIAGDSRVFFDIKEVKKQCKKDQKTYGNLNLEVVEIVRIG